MPSTETVFYTIQPGDSLCQIARRHHTTVPIILAQNARLNPGRMTAGTTIQIAPAAASAMAREEPQLPLALSNDMRLAWEQHVYWTRMVLISIAERLPDLTDTLNRLMRNPGDLADIFACFYPAARATIEQLLTEHLQIGGDIMVALRDGNAARAQALTAQWYQNADQMAVAFRSINPYYDPETTRGLLYEHLALTTKEVEARIAKNYAADIAAFDEVEMCAMRMADYFTAGIARQFPDCM